MLQFLSLVYESIAGSWLDMVESNIALGTNGSKFYHQIISVFRQIASPFLPFQERLSELEVKHSGVACQFLAQDIRRIVAGVSSESIDRLGFLQDASEGLQRLSTSIFPIAEGALARFELLNGGSGAALSLNTVDQLLSENARKLAGAVHTLSRAMNSDLQKLAESFDEQHVLCALQILKLAGSYRRDMRTFQTKTVERLSVILGRMSVHIAREREAQNAPGGRTPFTPPDALSVVEIDSYLTQTLHGESEETGESFAVIQRFVASDGAMPLYPQTDEAVRRLAHSCLSFVFDVCSSVPRYHISDMSSMIAWKEESSQDESVSYGTLPQHYITQVGEHMLALVQALEPFSSDAEALALANEAMDGVRSITVQPWIDFVSTFGSSASERMVRLLMDGTNIRGHVVASAVVEDEEVDDEELDEAVKASSDFCNAWLDVVGLAVTGRLLERIMRIPSMTSKGCEHVNADLNYLVNVFTALGVSGHPHPLLGHVAEMAILDGDALAERISSRDRADDIDEVLRSVEERLAAMRGLSANYRY